MTLTDPKPTPIVVLSARRWREESLYPPAAFPSRPLRNLRSLCGQALQSASPQGPNTKRQMPRANGVRPPSNLLPPTVISTEASVSEQVERPCVYARNPLPIVVLSAVLARRTPMPASRPRGELANDVGLTTDNRHPTTLHPTTASSRSRALPPAWREIWRAVPTNNSTVRAAFTAPRKTVETPGAHAGPRVAGWCSGLRHSDKHGKRRDVPQQLA